MNNSKVKYKLNIGDVVRFDLHGPGKSYDNLTGDWNWGSLSEEDYKNRYLYGVVTEQDFAPDYHINPKTGEREKGPAYSVNFGGKHGAVHYINEGWLRRSQKKLTEDCPCCKRPL